MQVFNLYRPTIEPKGIISIPHSGTNIPDEFFDYLTDDPKALLQDVDYKVEELISIPTLLDAGIFIITANVLRTCLDLNRDGAVAPLNWKQNTHGVQVVTKEPEPEVVKAFTATYHKPYYDELDRLVEIVGTATKKKVPFIDLHSMPSKPSEYHLKQNPDQNPERPDLCISDLKGESCDLEFIDQIIVRSQNAGLNAKKNDPYFGGNITKYMNKESTQNIQIEINRSLYMDEEIQKLIPAKAGKLREQLTKILLNTFNEFY